jgi:uncharacterized DUF497 family protein
MTFEFDPRKAAANLKKHGVSFEEAATAFFDEFCIGSPDPEHSIDEERFILIGQSTRSRILFVVYTEADSIVRLISARVATATERNTYEENA